ncbi:hypothetical protein EVAR_73412_1 [Eumeta japonica]|uniref:Uncharacterized protein n=1 Tax=Eumeta variegata TaxID=151549 RepID=A0A4C1TKF8_EUMVA|nr:hypothetical protein EVAR_73412_1 [Eumeta japonica]
MHGFTNLFNKNQSRESTPPLEKEDRPDRCASPAVGAESHRNEAAEAKTRAISITPRGSSGQRSLRGIPGSPFEVASSPRDRYPNFVSYFREVMENRVANSQQHYATHHHDYRRQRSDGERYQSGAGAHHAPRHDYKHFVSPLYGDVMDDIQENDYNKCERYGEISNTRLAHVPKNRFDNRSFAQKLTENLRTESHQTRDRRDSGGHTKEDAGFHNERRGSGSCAARHKHNPIQDLFRSIGKKVGSWRHEPQEARRGSCAAPAAITQPQNKSNKDEFRSRSKSLDAEHLHTASQRPWLEDCGIAYQIFDEILREGKHSCFL